MLPTPLFCSPIDIVVANSGRAFIDKVTITLNDCESQYLDGNVYYLFYYLVGKDQDDYENLPISPPTPLVRKYLTKYQTSKTIEVLLPPGVIYIYGLAKNSREGVFS